jgi:hypothetical protein
VVAVESAREFHPQMLVEELAKLLGWEREWSQDQGLALELKWHELVLGSHREPSAWDLPVEE